MIHVPRTEIVRPTINLQTRKKPSMVTKAIARFVLPYTFEFKRAVTSGNRINNTIANLLGCAIKVFYWNYEIGAARKIYLANLKEKVRVQWQDPRTKIIRQDRADAFIRHAQALLSWPEFIASQTDPRLKVTLSQKLSAFSGGEALNPLFKISRSLIR